jgi:phosphatidylglycerol:prolipoprotein diacylglycerol transferase
MFTHPQFDPVAIALGPMAVHWYGLMYLLSFLVGWAVAVYRTRLPHIDWTREEIGDYLFYVVLGVVLVVGALIVAINMLVDALRVWMDPRLRDVG